MIWIYWLAPANYCAYGSESSHPFLHPSRIITSTPTPSSPFALLFLEIASPLHVSLPSLRNPTGWPLRLSPIVFHLPFDSARPLSAPVRYVFQRSRHPRLISLNLFPSLRVCVRPRCDLGDISTVTPVTVRRGEHRPPRATQGTEVLLICERNARTNGGEGGLSLTHSLSFENTALYGECVFHWVCEGRQKKKRTRRREARMKEHLITWQT